MINVPKPLREEVKRIMSELEAKQLGNFSEEQVLHRVQRLEELFGIYGIEPLKDYHKRLERFLSTASEYFSFMGPDRRIKSERAKNERERKRDCTGMSGETMVRVKGFLDHLFLERVYRGSIKLSWSFNREGRLDLVDSMLFPSNSVCNLVITEDYREPPYDWTSRRVEYKPVPEQIRLVNPGFAILEKDKMYLPIMRFGHAMARDLIKNINSGNIRDNHLLQPLQKQLREIVNDFECMDMIRKAGSIMPYLAEKDGDGNSAVVEYHNN